MSAIDSFLRQLGIAAVPGAVGCVVVGLLSLLYGYRLFVFLGGFAEEGGF